jgi:hypothetical protein
MHQKLTIRHVITSKGSSQHPERKNRAATLGPFPALIYVSIPFARIYRQINLR